MQKYVTVEIPMEREMIAYIEDLRLKISQRGAPIEFDDVICLIVSAFFNKEVDIDLSKCKTENDIVEVLKRI